jgi:4-amino-4-deoxy-L-arabinose transferase-like glycosyltransferase
MRPAESPIQASKAVSSSGGPLSQRNKVLLVLLLLLGTFLLLYKFPSAPVGLHQDEMSEAYEAYALLHTGADRWGYHLPVYFLSWGSGQNVLQSYLTIPVVAVLGLTRLSARLIPILCGLLTLPLFFFTLRRWFGDTTALIGLFFLAISPWHIMISRWGIENSPLPFFMLLGVFTFGRALQSRSTWQILISLLPFALALYTYGVVVVIVPVLIPLLLLIDLPAVWKARRAWLGAIAIFCVTSLPIAFYTFKNYVLKTNYAFERWLPFTVPLLPITRLDQVSKEKLAPTIIGSNMLFFRKGLSDGVAWFQVPNNPPIQRILLLLIVIGMVWQLVQLVRQRRFSGPFLPWLIACVPACFLIPFNISRGIALFLPLLAMAAIATALILTLLRKPILQAAFAVVLGLLLLRPTARFIRAYYGAQYATDVKSTFYPDMPKALADVQQLAGPTMPIFLSEGIAINHVQVLFLTKTDPAVFQRSGATYDHPDFGRWRFRLDSLPNTPRPFAYLIKNDDPPVCANPTHVQSDGQFVIGICR